MKLCIFMYEILFTFQQDNAVQHELLKRVENLGDDFFQMLTDDIGEEDEDGFTTAENYPLSVISLVSNADDPRSSIEKQRYKTLKGHTPTRWHSILMMLESLGTQRLAVSRTLYRLNSKYTVSENEWELIYQLIEFLKIFRSAVEMFSFERKPTLPTTLVFRTEIIGALKVNEKNNSIMIKLKENLAKGLDNRFPVTEELLTASILDPRLSNLPVLQNELDKRDISKFEFLRLQVMKVSSDVSVPVAPIDLPQPSLSKPKKTASLLSTLIEKHAYNDTQSSDVEQTTREINEEIHKYFLTVIPKDVVDSFDILEFWKNNSKTLPKLAQLSRKILCIPATSVSSERAFSHAGILVNAKRSSLGPSVINKTLFIHDNYSLIKKFVFESE